MIAEAPFLFSIAALNASLAGLAGLVAGLRRGAEFRALDRIRLRQIVEFAFANILLVVSVLPLAELLGGLEPATQLVAVVAIVYTIGISLVLLGRLRESSIHMTRGWAAGATSINVLILLLAIFVLADPSFGWFALLQVVMLARPMLAFLLVLGSMESA